MPIDLNKKDKNKDGKVTGFEEAKNQFESGTLSATNKDTIRQKLRDNVSKFGEEKGLAQTRQDLKSVSVDVPGQQEPAKLDPVAPAAPTAPTGSEIVSPEVPKTPEVPNEQVIEEPITGAGVIPDETGQEDNKIISKVDQAEELRNEADAKLEADRVKAIDDTKRGYALGKGKFDENKENYTNYDEISTKYNAVIDEITANMSDTGVIDESVYQSIASKYGLTIEQVKNPNRILDLAELSDEGKENLGVNDFEKGIADATKDFDRTIEDLNGRITQAEQSYRNQMDDSQRAVGDVIQSMNASGAASGLYRSTALNDSINKTREQGDRTFQRLNQAKNRTVGDITTNITRITEDFEQAITDAKKEFDDNYKEVNTQNMLALNEAGLNYTGEKLREALDEIENNFEVGSLEVLIKYNNALSGINNSVLENIELTERLADQEEAKELKSYNQYLENDGLLLQSSSLQEIIAGVQNGTISPESAENLRKIMQTSIQSTLGSIAPLELGDIDNINYLLEQNYTPEQAVALMRESFDKFQQVEEEEAPTQDWNKLSDDSLYNERTGEIKKVDGTITNTSIEDSQSISDFSTQKRGTKNLQCGMLVNDYILQQTGQDPTGNSRFTDTLDEKIQALESIGVSGIPVAGGIFVSNPLGNDVGHTGIVKSVNADGSITVLEANAGGSSEGEPPVETTYTAQQVQDMQFSQSVTSQEDNSDLFSYAETLTSSDRTKFLQERGLEDSYISYKANQGGKGADFSDIKDITDVNFPDKTTEFKTKSFTFGNRMQNSEKAIDEMVEKFSRGISTSGTEAVGGWLPNFLKTDERQKFEQSQRNFINAVLRQESGAAIAESEFNNAREQYMPQPGDSEAVMNQKKQNRLTAIENMYRNSGKDDKGRNIVDIYKSLYGRDNVEETSQDINNLDNETLKNKYSNTGFEEDISELDKLSDEDILKEIQ